MPDHDRRTFLTSMAAAAAALPFAGGAAKQDALAGLPELIRDTSVPGLAAAIVDAGAVTRATGAGVRRAGSEARVSGDTVFEAASLSKPVFAYVVLKLAASGSLDLDAPIGAAFREPDFRSDPRVDSITPRLVLSHQTGLLNWRPAREPQRFLFDPGKGFGYSGEAYVRLQRHIEGATGQTLSQLADAHVFGPLQMRSSGFVWRDGFEAIAAEGHDAAGNPVKTRLWGNRGNQELPPLMAVPNAAASLMTTASDYARFLQHIVVTPPRGMFDPAVRVNDSIEWGLGFGLSPVAGARTAWQWGNNGPYRAFAIVIPARRAGLVVLTNSANGMEACRRITNRFVEGEHPAFLWPPVR